VYVPNASSATGYDLYAFENGSPNVLAQRGWSKTSFAAGDPIAVTYWPRLCENSLPGQQARMRRATFWVMSGRRSGPQRRDQRPAAHDLHHSLQVVG
jgi:hypothetical protein